MTKRLALLYLVAAAAGLSPAAASDPRIRHVGAPSLSVTTADLDLTTVDGRTALDRRILRAATALCTPEPGLSSPRLDAERAVCIEDTVMGARDLRKAAIAQQRKRAVQTADATQR